MIGSGKTGTVVAVDRNNGKFQWRATIGKHHAFFKHYHTAGVPGRHEIGDDQELHYPAICRAIRDTGFDGYLAQEFIPTAPDPVGSLREAIRLCDV